MRDLFIDEKIEIGVPRERIGEGKEVQILGSASDSRRIARFWPCRGAVDDLLLFSAL